MSYLSKEQSAARQKTLLAALLLSAPGPLVTGIAAVSSGSSTQLADFIRRSAELVALFVSWWVFRKTHRQEGSDEAHRSRLERTAALSVAGAMCCSGAVMLIVALSRLPAPKPSGKVTSGLVIASLGLLTNAWFWRRYTILAREQFNSVIEAQRQLYRAKTWVDLCVVIALATVAIAPAHPGTPYVDIVGSGIVAGYLLWSGIRTARA